MQYDDLTPHWFARERERERICENENETCVLSSFIESKCGE